MKQYHVNPASDQPVVCKGPAACPHPGEVSYHAATAEEAKSAYDARLMAHYLSNPVTPLVDSLLATRGELPERVMRILGNHLEENGFQVLAITPSGSMLYNTELPHRATHDYDFVVFVKDDERLPRYRHSIVGDVDFFIVPLSLVPSYSRQGQIVEGYFAVRAGLALYEEEFTPLDDEDELLRSYFENLQEYIGKHEAGEYPPHRLEREHKHMLRWRLYLARGAETVFTPRLDGVERMTWLDAFSRYKKA